MITRECNKQKYCQKCQSKVLQGNITIERTARECNNQMYSQGVSQSKELPDNTKIKSISRKGNNQKYWEKVSQVKVQPRSATTIRTARECHKQNAIIISSYRECRDQNYIQGSYISFYYTHATASVIFVVVTVKRRILQNHFVDQSLILHGVCMVRWNESLFAASGSYDQLVAFSSISIIRKL